MEKTETEAAQELVHRILQREQPAETDMVNRYARGLLFILRRKCNNNEELAKDIAQETWRIVIEKIRNNELRDSRKLSAFIVQIGKNQVIMYFRKSENKNMVTSGDSNELERLGETNGSNADESHLNPETTLLNHNLGLLVRSVILELGNARDRELIMRFFIKEQEKRVICKDLELETQHFDRVLYRAKQRFKALWLQYQDTS